MHVKAPNGVFEKFPYPYHEFKADLRAAGISARDDMPEERQAEFGRFPVEPADPPAVSRWQIVRTVDPIKVGDTWTQQWEIESMPLSLDDKKADIRRQVEQIACQKRNDVVAGTSPAEMASWPIKRTEALAYQASEVATDAPNLVLEANARGVTLDDLVAKVLAKAAQLSALEAAVAGRSGALQDAAAVAEDEAALLALDIEAGWPV